MMMMYALNFCHFSILWAQKYGKIDRSNFWSPNNLVRWDKSPCKTDQLTKGRSKYPRKGAFTRQKNKDLGPDFTQSPDRLGNPTETYPYETQCRDRPLRMVHQRPGVYGLP
jgi:hypothetical protein